MTPRSTGRWPNTVVSWQQQHTLHRAAVVPDLYSTQSTTRLVDKIGQ